MAFISENYDSNKYVSIWNHTKPIPEVLKSCSTQEFDTIIQLVSDTVIKLRETTNSLQFQDILNRKILEIQNSIQSEYETKLNSIQSETTRKFNIEIERLQKSKQELQVSLDQSIKSYQNLNLNFENLQTSSVNQFDKTLNTMLQKQKESYESQIQMLDKVYKEQISNLQNSLEQYTKQSIKDQNSSLKGKVGETSFDSLVEQHTSWTIENTAGSAQHCDRFGIIHGCKTLFEIKNYSNTIPKKEVDKFKRDMEVHKDCPVGVFISLNTNIVGAPQDFFYSEITNSNQTLIYIQKFMLNEPISLFPVIDSIIKLGNTLYNKSINNTIEDNDVQTKIDSIKPILVNEIKSIGSILNELNNNKKLIIEKVNEHHNSIKTHIDRMKYTFEKIFSILFNDKEIIQEDVVMAPPPEAKKARSSKKSTSSSVLFLEQ